MKPLWERQLDDDLEWRMAELASLKVQVIRYNKGDQPYETLIRALTAMLYAHYEGYCLFALNVYLDELEKANLNRRVCKKQMILFSLEEEIRHFRGNASTLNCFDFFTFKLNQLLDERLVFERDPKNKSEFLLKGRSNLYPENLQEHCASGCLDVPAVASHFQELKALVLRRNGIAHGRKIIIDDLAKYQPYENAAVAAMHELAYAVIDSLTNGHYLEPVVEFHI